VRSLGWILIALAFAPARRDPCPFTPGEHFTYEVRVARMGAKGHGDMWVSGPEVVRGTETYVLHFNSAAGVGPFRGSDRTTSWIDPQRMAAMRFEKLEHHLLESHHDEVEIYPVQRRWSAADGTTGVTETDSPLDELSFMYFVRMLPLMNDSVYVLDRHYDAARNPTSVRVTAHERIETRTGTFETIRVEMRVKDPRHYRGDGLLILNLSDDARRVPVRIESTVPVFGKTVLTLESILTDPPAP
jgi:hypothetical protein